MTFWTALDYEKKYSFGKEHTSEAGWDLSVVVSVGTFAEKFGDFWTIVVV